MDPAEERQQPMRWGVRGKALSLSSPPPQRHLCKPSSIAESELTPTGNGPVHSDITQDAARGPPCVGISKELHGHGLVAVRRELTCRGSPGLKHSSSSLTSMSEGSWSGEIHMLEGSRTVQFVYPRIKYVILN